MAIVQGYTLTTIYSNGATDISHHPSVGDMIAEMDGTMLNQFSDRNDKPNVAFHVVHHKLEES